MRKFTLLVAGVVSLFLAGSQIVLAQTQSPSPVPPGIKKQERVPGQGTHKGWDQGQHKGWDKTKGTPKTTDVKTKDVKTKTNKGLEKEKKGSEKLVNALNADEDKPEGLKEIQSSESHGKGRGHRK